jgi:hypothetical protein
MALRVVLVLHPHRAPEGGDRESRHIPCGEDVLVPVGAPGLIDGDPVVDREAGGSRELRARLDPETGHDDIRVERALEGLVAIASFQHQVSFVLERHRRGTADADVVLDEEDSFTSHRPRIVNQEPVTQVTEP